MSSTPNMDKLLERATARPWALSNRKDTINLGHKRRCIARFQCKAGVVADAHTARLAVNHFEALVRLAERPANDLCSFIDESIGAGCLGNCLPCTARQLLAEIESQAGDA